MDKKKIFAIVLFLIMGFFMFTFANPSQELERVPGNDTEEKEDENKQDENKQDENKQDENKDDQNTETNENENDQDDEDVVVEVNNAPTITVTPEIVKILKGESYNILNGVVVEDEEELTANASLTDTTKLEIGSHEVTYTVTDNAGQTATAKRTIIVLDPKGDEDNDGYTNEEEKEAGTDFDDKEEYPDYQPNPTIDLTACDKEMTVYDLTPDFGTCVKATDEYYGTEGVEVNVDTTKVNPNKFGSYEVTVKATDNLGNETVETFTLKVLKREVTVTINDVNAKYGDELHELTSNANEVAYNNHDILVTLNTDATKDSDAGKYAITGTWTNDNYDVTFVNGTYNVSAKDLTEEDLDKFGVVFEDATFDYDKTTKSLEVTNLPEGFEVNYTNNAKVNAGTYEVVATIKSNNINYTGEVSLTGTLTINKANVTITPDNKTSVYGAAMEELTYQITSGTVYGNDDLNVVLTKAYGVDAGTYDITATATNDNYNITLNKGVYTITPRELTENIVAKLGINFDNKEVIYNGEVEVIKVSGLLPEGISVTYNNNIGKNVGTYSATAIITGSGNYTGEVKLYADLVISPKHVDVVWTNTEFTYDGTLKLPTATVDTGVLGDTIDLYVSLVSGTDGISAGNHKATASMKVANANYILNNTTTTYTINKAAIDEDDLKDVVFENVTVDYNGEVHSLAVSNLDTTKYDVKYLDNNNKDAGTYTVTAVITAKDNYSGEVRKTATLTINKANVTLTANDKASEIGHDLVALDYKIAGTIYNNDFEPKLTTTALKDVKGTYPITFEAINHKNYNVTLNNGTYKVFEDLNNNDTDDDTEAKYTVTFESVDERGTLTGKTVYENILEDLTFEQAGIVVPTTNPKNEYYRFKEWTLNDVVSEPSNTTVVTGDLTYKAHFEPINDENGNGIADEEEFFSVIFQDFDGTQIGEVQTVQYGKSAVAPQDPYREDWTFIGWDTDYSSVKQDLVVKALYEAKQTGIKVVEKPNVQFQFQKGTNPDFTKLITVYEIYADGREIETTNYTTDVDTSRVVDHKVLTITENGFTNTDITYSVINEEAFQSKFEIKFTGEHYYYETKRSYCTNNCDKEDNVKKVDTEYNFLEVVEHYDENIDITAIEAFYTNGTTENLKFKDAFGNDNIVRWTHKKGGSTYNPVYIATTNRGLGFLDWTPDDIMDENYVISTVEVTYVRDGYGTYKVIFKYNANTMEFTPYDEVKIS